MVVVVCMPRPSLNSTYSLHCGSLLGLCHWILNLRRLWQMKKELQWSLELVNESFHAAVSWGILAARIAAKNSCRISSQELLGGSWVVRSGVISPLIWVINIATLLISSLINTHEPPSNLRA